MRKIAATFRPAPMGEEARELAADDLVCFVTVLRPSDRPRKGVLLDKYWALRIDAAGVEWQMPISESTAKAIIADHD